MGVDGRGGKKKERDSSRERRDEGMKRKFGKDVRNRSRQKEGEREKEWKLRGMY